MATLAKQAQRLNRRWRKRRRPKRCLPPLLLLSDPERLADPRPLLSHLPRGSGVLLRPPRLPSDSAAGPFQDLTSSSEALRAERAEARMALYKQTLALAKDIVRACRSRGLIVLIAGDAALARRLHAHGLHLPEARIPRAGRLRRPWPGFLISAACHHEAALFRAGRAGADLALLSPIFPTESHPGAPALGPLRLAALARILARRYPGLAILALGGISERRAAALSPIAIAGLAGIGAFTRAKDSAGDPDPAPEPSARQPC